MGRVAGATAPRPQARGLREACQGLRRLRDDGEGGDDRRLAQAEVSTPPAVFLRPCRSPMLVVHAGRVDRWHYERSLRRRVVIDDCGVCTAEMLQEEEAAPMVSFNAVQVRLPKDSFSRWLRVSQQSDGSTLTPFGYAVGRASDRESLDRDHEREERVGQRPFSAWHCLCTAFGLQRRHHSHR